MSEQNSQNQKNNKQSEKSNKSEQFKSKAYEQHFKRLCESTFQQYKEIFEIEYYENLTISSQNSFLTVSDLESNDQIKQKNQQKITFNDKNNFDQKPKTPENPAQSVENPQEKTEVSSQKNPLFYFINQQLQKTQWKPYAGFNNKFNQIENDLIIKITNKTNQNQNFEIPFKLNLQGNINIIKNYQISFDKNQTKLLVVEITKDQEAINVKFLQLEKDLQVFAFLLDHRNYYSDKKLSSKCPNLQKFLSLLEDINWDLNQIYSVIVTNGKEESFITNMCQHIQILFQTKFYQSDFSNIEPQNENLYQQKIVNNEFSELIQVFEKQKILSNDILDKSILGQIFLNKRALFIYAIGHEVELFSQITKLNELVHELQLDKQEKDQKIVKLNATIQDLNATIQDQNTRISNLEKIVTQLQNQSQNQQNIAQNQQSNQI